MIKWKLKWDRMPKWLRVISMVVGGVAAAVVLGLVFGILVRELWNWLMPELFGLKTITYWQAFGIVILGQLICGGSSSSNRGGESKSSRRRKHRDPCGEDEGDSEGLKHWKYYDEWWNSEGKKAFHDYVGKTNTQTEGRQNGEEPSGGRQ